MIKHALQPDELFSERIQSLCPTITGNVCCTEYQFETLRAQVQQVRTFSFLFFSFFEINTDSKVLNLHIVKLQTTNSFKSLIHEMSPIMYNQAKSIQHCPHVRPHPISHVER